MNAELKTLFLEFENRVELQTSNAPVERTCRSCAERSEQTVQTFAEKPRNIKSHTRINRVTEKQFMPAHVRRLNDIVPVKWCQDGIFFDVSEMYN